jgi:hypothetical protein
MKFNIYKHKKQTSPIPLRIQDVKEAPMTPEPDDAEIAVQAILEVMLEKNAKKTRKKTANKNGKGAEANRKNEEPNSVAYYKHLSKHICEAYRSARLRALRFLCFCEQQLEDPDIPAYGHGSIALLEAELYKRLDVVEREGGDMKKRWQHCLAEVTLRLMNAPLPDNEECPGDATETLKDNV